MAKVKTNRHGGKTNRCYGSTGCVSSDVNTKNDVELTTEQMSRRVAALRAAGVELPKGTTKRVMAAQAESPATVAEQSFSHGRSKSVRVERRQGVSATALAEARAKAAAAARGLGSNRCDSMPRSSGTLSLA